MPFYGIKMYFISPVHIGKHGIGMEGSDIVIHSDTLYSIIFQMRVKMYGIAEQLPIKLTSAFPFVRDIYNLPKPCLKPPGFDKEEIRAEYAKTVKSTSFVSLDIFDKWIKGEEIDYKTLMKIGSLLSDNIKVDVRPRIAVDRLSSNTALYFGGGTIFKKGEAGLYFLIECGKDEYRMLKEIFTLLQEEGIGGEKSSGYGRFETEFVENFKLPTVDDGNKYITLSLYCPINKEEISGIALSYQLVKRTGWSICEGKHVLQKRLLMFAEGSVFGRQVVGKIANVSPDREGHPIYKYGKAFLVKAR